MFQVRQTLVTQDSVASTLFPLTLDFSTPVLISGEDGKGLHGYNDGWTGKGESDPQWWRHARNISQDAETRVGT